MYPVERCQQANFYFLSVWAFWSQVLKFHGTPGILFFLAEKNFSVREITFGGALASVQMLCFYTRIYAKRGCVEYGKQCIADKELLSLSIGPSEEIRWWQAEAPPTLQRDTQTFSPPSTSFSVVSENWIPTPVPIPTPASTSYQIVENY